MVRMNVLEKHEISESSHRILNPFSEDKLMRLGELGGLRPGMRQLDLASGKGEMLCRWAERFGISGLGVDISDVFIFARARADELEVSDLVSFELADAAMYAVEEASYDVVSCIGATWIGDGLIGTVQLLSPALRLGGLEVIGEPFWNEEPTTDTLAALGIAVDEFTTLPGTLERFDAAGADLVEMVLADGDSWDRYVAAQWWNVREWLDVNPDNPDATEMREVLDASRRTPLSHQRRHLGWGVFVLRTSEPGRSEGHRVGEQAVPVVDRTAADHCGYTGEIGIQHGDISRGTRDEPPCAILADDARGGSGRRADCVCERDTSCDEGGHGAVHREQAAGQDLRRVRQHNSPFAHLHVEPADAGRARGCIGQSHGIGDGNHASCCRSHCQR